jgi:xanthine dehydrogenase accessory factor
MPMESLASLAPLAGPVVVVRGGGDLASGVILRLARSGIRVVVLEIARPLAVRRLVAFAEAVFTGETTVEDVQARLAPHPSDVLDLASQGIVPVLVDPEGASISSFKPLVLVDARMIKRPPEIGKDAAPLVIGLGPGFYAGGAGAGAGGTGAGAMENCHAVIETQRGPFLGRVIWQGGAALDTGQPEVVFGQPEVVYGQPDAVTMQGGAQVKLERVLRAPADGLLVAHASIGDRLGAGQVIAEVNGQPLVAPFGGVLRGLLRSGMSVVRNLKVGDLDPRNDPRLCRLVSDKALAVGGGVLEALLAQPEIRARLWAQ